METQLFDLTDKVVVITGGSGALGGALADHFAAQNCKVVILNRDEEKMNQKVEELQAINPSCIGLVCDVLDVQTLESTNKEIIKRFGKIDILINAAGGNVSGATQQPDQQVFDLDISAIDSALDLNLKGTLYPSLIFGRTMAEGGSGSIINVSSMAAYSAITRVMSYSMAKSGINSLTSWMACELAKKYGDKVRVNAIAPGFFIGEQNRKLLLNEDGTLTERSQKVIQKTPMGRFGKIEEVAGAVHFLCSEGAAFITGAIIPVDGGFSSFSGV
ncbi:MAG: D-mannonate oxidoreductase [Rickettsiales bacterium]|nr:D-mannonate oxidoreductase [Rickettsiales bacterium]MBR11134.1 D-mannonate oxidoreductase [Rickettsiales bacterium]